MHRGKFRCVVLLKTSRWQLFDSWKVILKAGNRNKIQINANAYKLHVKKTEYCSVRLLNIGTAFSDACVPCRNLSSRSLYYISLLACSAVNTLVVFVPGVLHMHTVPYKLYAENNIVMLFSIRFSVRICIAH